MVDQTMQTITKDVENDLLGVIVQNLREHKFKVEQAKQLAREFLVLLPLQDKRDLLEKLYKLELKHSETKAIYLKYAIPIEEEDRLKKLELMSQHIKNGQIDHALAVAKGGLQNVRT